MGRVSHTSELLLGLGKIRSLKRVCANVHKVLPPPNLGLGHFPSLQLAYFIPMEVGSQSPSSQVTTAMMGSASPGTEDILGLEEESRGEPGVWVLRPGVFWSS